MFLDCVIPIPTAKGRISVHRQKKMTVVMYKVDRVYNPKTQMSEPKRVMIGRVVDKDKKLMTPNENFAKFFPDLALPVEEKVQDRSDSVKGATFVLYEKIVKDLRLQTLLKRHFDDAGLMLDLACYMITSETNVAQHYHEYAFNHPLWTEGMQIKSDSSISRLLQSVNKDQITGFLNDWNRQRGSQSRVYISYDSTNKNSSAVDLDLVEYGHAKDDAGLPIFNMAIAYDQTNQIPLSYELYPGSINDVSQLTSFIDTLRAYHYRNVGIILDRGYFSRQNFAYMDQHNFPFLIMMKGHKALASKVIKQVRGSFEASLDTYVQAYHLNATTVAHKLYDTDEKVRYFHVCYDNVQAGVERENFLRALSETKALLKAKEGTVYRLDESLSQYFDAVYSGLEDSPERIFLGATAKDDAIKEHMNQCGYFCLVSSEDMPASEAVHLYKGRDSTEKLFMSMKTFLGAATERVHSSESLQGKVFIEFIALIIRSRIYNLLKEHMQRLNCRKNYLTVPAALRELEKGELTRRNEGNYQQRYALTKNQREIFQAIGLSMEEVKSRMQNIANRLTAAVAPELEDEPSAF